MNYVMEKIKNKSALDRKFYLLSSYYMFNRPIIVIDFEKYFKFINILYSPSTNKTTGMEVYNEFIDEKKTESMIPQILTDPDYFENSISIYNLAVVDKKPLLFVSIRDVHNTIMYIGFLPTDKKESTSLVMRSGFSGKYEDLSIDDTGVFLKNLASVTTFSRPVDKTPRDTPLKDRVSATKCVLDPVILKQRRAAEFDNVIAPAIRDPPNKREYTKAEAAYLKGEEYDSAQLQIDREVRKKELLFYIRKRREEFIDTGK